MTLNNQASSANRTGELLKIEMGLAKLFLAEQQTTIAESSFEHFKRIGTVVTSV